MAVHDGKPEIRHKNMADGVAKNGGWFSHLKEDCTETKMVNSQNEKLSAGPLVLCAIQST